MPSSRQLLEQMLLLFDALIDHAQMLEREVSVHCSEEIIRPLEERQTEILREIQMLDALLKEQKSDDAVQDLQEKVKLKISEFAAINKKFIENVKKQI